MRSVLGRSLRILKTELPGEAQGIAVPRVLLVSFLNMSAPERSGLAVSGG